VNLGTLEIHTSPHVHSGDSTDVILRNVLVAALPVAAFAVYAHGLSALLLLIVATGSCIVTEHLLCRHNQQDSTIGDWSAAVTGILLGLTLPPGLPLWMAAAGGFIAIGLGKLLFGGLGYNTFNPALVGRAVLQGAFPVSMTTWSTPFGVDRFSTLPSSTLTWPFVQPVYDSVTGATPLAALKFESQATPMADLAFGFVSGSTGEASAVLILLGGLYLALRNMLNWRIPATIFATVGVLSGLFHVIDPARFAGPEFMLLAGGLCLGAVFMATDMVTAPLTHRGVVVYGILIGTLVTVIRYWGGLPEGVQYSILLGNACVPLIDRAIQPKTYGQRQREADKT
jgi:Na+-translocating ferredoxin:NAD+ oxidoreductase subunit D